MRVLFIGDIVGKGGLRAVSKYVQELSREYRCSFVIANGENMAGGAGLNERGCKELFKQGVNVITSGDHVWDQHGVKNFINGMPNLLRPANLHVGQPGKGYGVYNIPIGGKICVINLMGRVFMKLQGDCPFQLADKIINEVKGKTKTIFVDFHAEATSEKIAMGRYLDGRVTAVLGTHTHTPTADEQIFPKGTAYISDVGMVGSSESILGREIEPVLHRFATGLPKRFYVNDRDVVIHGAIVEFDIKTGLASNIERIKKPVPNED